MFNLHRVHALLPAFVLMTGCASSQHNPTGASAPQVEFALQKVAFRLGDTKIHAQLRQFGTNTLTMVNLHDDEQASVEAAVVVLEKRGGRLVELVHTGKRRVVFLLGGKEYSFDPNRIFSPAGVRLTVKGDEPVAEEAYATVARFAAQFIRYFKLDRQPAFITLHNNGPGGLSIHSYEPGGEWEADTDRVFASPVADPDDFYFVTNERVFEALMARKLNVILQDNRIRRDDGSLSVFAGRHAINYINVEAEPGHLNEQVRMIELAVEVIR